MPKKPSPSVLPDAPLRGSSLSAILVWVRDFPGVLRFYRDTLGLEVGYSNEKFAELRAARGAGIALHAGAEGEAPAHQDLLMEFVVADIESVRNALIAKGVEVDPIRDQPYGRITEFRDPEGHRLGLEQSARR